MASLILSQISIGIVLMLLTIPLAKLGRGFFAFHVGLALALDIIAVALAPAQLKAHAPYLAPVALLAVLFIVRKLRWVTHLLWTAAITGIGTLCIDAMGGGMIAVNSLTAALAAGLNLCLSAFVLGSVLVTMNLGHWYLVIHGLPFELLGVANRRCAYALAAKIAGILAGMALVFDSWRALFIPQSGPLWDTVLFLTVRVAFGLAAPLLLAWMIHECVKIKSNQSATGILYVSLVFVLIGEISGLYFLMERGVPL